MAEDIALEVQEILVEAWNKFFNEFYNKIAPELAKQTCSDKKEAEQSHWICWNEYDLMFHIGRLFYNILSEKKKEKYSNIQIHFEKNVNFSNFSDYNFKNRLEELKENLKMKRGPKIDIIIAYENSFDPFLLCAEVKFFHGRPYEDPIEQIKRDIEKLKAIRSCKIAEKTVFMLLDDYYFYTDKETSNDIKNKLHEIEITDKDITILSRNTEAKLHEYK